MGRRDGVRVRRLAFAGAVAVCLLRPAYTLLFELPATPVARGASSSELRRLYRPAHLDRVRRRAPDGDVALELALPEGAGDPAALLYYQLTYDLHPRRVLVTAEPYVINDGRDLLRAPKPDPAWLAARGVAWRIVAEPSAGGIAVSVRRVVRP